MLNSKRFVLYIVTLKQLSGDTSSQWNLARISPNSWIWSQDLKDRTKDHFSSMISELRLINHTSTSSSRSSFSQMQRWVSDLRSWKLRLKRGSKHLLEKPWAKLGVQKCQCWPLKKMVVWVRPFLLQALSIWEVSLRTKTSMPSEEAYSVKPEVRH